MDDFEMPPGAPITEYKNTGTLDTMFVVGAILFQVLYVVCIFTKLIKPITHYSNNLTSKPDNSID